MKLFFILIFIFIFLLPLKAFSFYLMTNVNAGFSSSSAKIYITSNSTCSNTGYSPEDILSMAYDGAQKFWNKVSTANFKIKDGGKFTTTNSNYLTAELCTNDSSSSCAPLSSVPTASDIIIACNSNTSVNFPQTNILAITAPNNISNKKIKGSVILINDAPNSEFANLSKAEAINVLAHEIGHAIGLGHTNRSEALMYSKDFDQRHKLAQDDIDGMTFLYPNQLDGCTGIFGTISISQDPPSPNFILSFLFGLFAILGLSKIGRLLQRRQRWTNIKHQTK